MNHCGPLQVFQRAAVGPFAHLNLSRNPFGELTRETRGELAVVSEFQFAGWLERLNSGDRFALQFIGPSGHGKTTHLLALRCHLARAEYLYLPEDGPQPRVPDARPLLLDEAQRLSKWRRWRLMHGRGPLVLGTHADLSPALRRYGWEIETVMVTTLDSAERTLEILNRRIEAARAGPGDVPCLELSQAIRLQQRFGGDLRSIEQFLYLQFQQLAWEQATWPLVI